MAGNGNEALAAEPDTPFSVTPLLGALLRVTHEALTLGILEVPAAARDRHERHRV